MKARLVLKPLLNISLIGLIIICFLVIIGLGYLFITIAAHNPILGFVEVNHESMLPTFESGKPTYIYNLDRSIKNGDIVLVEIDNPNGFPIISRKMNIIKRVIASPGQSIKFDEVWIFINGERISEPYIYGQITGLLPNGFVKYKEEYVLEENQYFIMGDNRKYSYDSRSFGPVLKEQILGYANDPNIELYKGIITW